jgi:hypothetical protein
MRGGGLAVIAVIVAGALAACAGDDDASPEPAGTTTVSTSLASAATVTPAPATAAATTAPITEPPTTADPSTESSTTATTATTVATPPPSTAAPTAFEPPVRARLLVTGPEEVVFDWSEHQCEPANIPDNPARAFRDSAGQVHLTIGHVRSYAMVGPTLDDVVIDCSAPILTSPFDPDPADFADSWWIGSPYTTDGQTVYAIAQHEFRGDTHAGARPSRCPSGQRLPCLDTSLVMMVSTDGGRTFGPVAAPPDHLVATLPYGYRADTVPSGIRRPSNLVRHSDGFFYLFGNVIDQPAGRQWVCAMRTDDLANPAAWRYWNGTEFTGDWLDPYRETATPADKCAPLAEQELAGSVQESVVFDERLGGYVMVGISGDPSTSGEPSGVYSSTSTDLLNWGARELMIELPSAGAPANSADDVVYAYPAIIDPDSASPNFETSDGAMYLYVSRFNAGTNSLDRDLVRFPIAVVEEQIPAPTWTFDTDGDTEGWTSDNDLRSFDAVDGELRMVSTGDDPSFLSGEIVVPAAYDQLTIRMRAEDAEGQYAQVFWTTEDDPEWSESKSTTFELRGVGEARDIVVDVGSIPGWQGVIRALRIDPLSSSGRTIEIDTIGFGHR